MVDAGQTTKWDEVGQPRHVDNNKPDSRLIPTPKYTAEQSSDALMDW